MSRFKSRHNLPKLIKLGVDFGAQSGPPSHMIVTAFFPSFETIGCKIFFKLNTCIALVLSKNIDGYNNTLSEPDLSHLIRSLPRVSINILSFELHL